MPVIDVNHALVYFTKRREIPPRKPREPRVHLVTEIPKRPSPDTRNSPEPLGTLGGPRRHHHLTTYAKEIDNPCQSPKSSLAS